MPGWRSALSWSAGPHDPIGGRSSDHHFRRLDNRHGIVPAPQPERADRVRGDHRREGLIADAQPHLSEEAVDPHFVHESVKAVARTEAMERDVAVSKRDAALPLRLLAREQPVDLRLSDAVMPPLRSGGADVAAAHPPLQGGVGDAELRRRRSHGQEGHVAAPPVHIEIERAWWWTRALMSAQGE